MKPRWVLDTNVLVSALLTERGPCAAIVDHARAGELILAWSPAMLAEYADVLKRPKFRLPASAVSALLAQFPPSAMIHPVETVPELPDPADEVFLATAMAADRVLVTGNAKHYPPELRARVLVLNPREALDRLRASESSSP